MTPGILARRRAEAQAGIVAAATELAERFSLDPTPLVSAPRDRDTAVTQLFELEAVADFLGKLVVASAPNVPALLAELVKEKPAQETVASRAAAAGRK